MDGLCRGCVLAVRAERTADTVHDFPAPTQLRLLFPGAECEARRLGRSPEARAAGTGRCVLPPVMPGQQLLFPVLRRLGAPELVELADRCWPEEEVLKRHTQELAQERGLSREWRIQVGRRLRLALAVRDAEGAWKVSREILDQGRGMQFGAAAAQEVLARAGLWQGPTQVTGRMRPDRVAAGIVRGCAHCGSWGITTRLCSGCAQWRSGGGHPIGRCGRCRRDGLPVHVQEGLCRGCLSFVRAVSPQSAYFTQLTFAGPLAHQLIRNSTELHDESPHEHGRSWRTATGYSPVPGQGALLTVPRDWGAVHAIPTDRLPLLLPQAQDLLAQFTACLPALAGGQQNHAHAVEVLHRLLAFSGNGPFPERDVRALAALEPKASLHRLMFFLHQRGLLDPDNDATAAASPSLARLDATRTDARHHQAIEDKLQQLPNTMAEQVRTWIAVRRGQGRRRHPPADFTRIRRDFHVALPVLTAWAQQGLDLRQITAEHVKAVLSDRQGHRARGVHHVLLSLFRRPQTGARRLHQSARWSLPHDPRATARTSAQRPAARTAGIRRHSNGTPGRRPGGRSRHQGL